MAAIWVNRWLYLCCQKCPKCGCLWVARLQTLVRQFLVDSNSYRISRLGFQEAWRLYVERDLRLARLPLEVPREQVLQPPPSVVRLVTLIEDFGWAGFTNFVNCWSSRRMTCWTYPGRSFCRALTGSRETGYLHWISFTLNLHWRFALRDGSQNFGLNHSSRFRESIQQTSPMRRPKKFVFLPFQTTS